MLNLGEHPQPRKANGRIRPVHDEAQEAREWLSSRIERARKIGIFAEPGNLTPALARVLMEKHNSRNRALRATRVETYAAGIKRGEWMLTGQGISLAVDGTLNNGQHRCAAVIAADEAIPCMFTFGESTDAFLVHDTGAARTAGDALRIDGHQNFTILAATARILWAIENGRPITGEHMSNPQVVEYVEKHPAMHEACAPGQRLRARIKGVSVAGCAAAYYLITQRTKHADKVEDFWDRACTGVGLANERDPVLKLREAMQRGSYLRLRNFSGVQLTAAIIIAWNAHVKRRQVGGVAWRDGVAFPEPI